MLSRDKNLLRYIDQNDDLNSFYIAAKSDQAEVLDYLFSFVHKNSSLYEQDEFYLDDLIFFVINHNVFNVMNFLIDNYPDYLDKVNDDFITPIFMSACSENFDMLGVFINHSSSIGVYPLSNHPDLLHKAVYFRKLELVKFLLDKTFCLGWKDSSYDTALHKAIVIRDSEIRFKISELLCINGADVNQKNKLGNSPLDLAIISEDTNIISLYIFQY